MPDTLPDLCFLARLLDIGEPFPFTGWPGRDLWLHVGYEIRNPVKNVRARRRVAALLAELPFQQGVLADAYYAPDLTRAADQHERWASHNHTPASLVFLPVRSPESKGVVPDVVPF